MGRSNTPRAKASHYITPEGYNYLGNEFNQLWIRRREVTAALTAAAAEGDRSENAEYIYRKKELREIDKRIRYLQIHMPRLKIVSEVGDNSRIFFGAFVSITDKEGKESRYRIVGPDEIDFKDEYISIDSLMGKTLLGRTVGDKIAIKTAKVVRRYVITAIEYSKE